MEITFSQERESLPRPELPLSRKGTVVVKSWGHSRDENSDWSVASTTSHSLLRHLIRALNYQSLLIAGVFGWLAWFGYSASLYFDVTDNGLYLLAADSRGVGGFGSGFGQVTGVLFSLVNRDIPAFRIVGGLILWAASYWLTHSFARLFWGPVNSANNSSFLGLISIFPVVSHYSLFGLQTPSYNWLSQVGMFLAAAVAIQFALLGESWSRREMMLHVGMCLAAIFLFWSKPSALLMVALFGAALLGLRKLKWLSLARLIFVSFTSFFAVFLMASYLSSFPDQLAANLRTLEMSQLLDPTYELGNAVGHFLNSAIPFLQWGLLIFATSATLVFIVARLSGRFRGPSDSWTLFLAIGIWLVLSIAQFDGASLSTKASVVVYLMTCFWLTWRILERAWNRKSGNSRLELYALFVAIGIPIGQAFGSNNGFVQVSLGAGVVVTMAFIVLREEFTGKGSYSLSGLGQIVIVGWLIASAYTNSVTPYRSEPLLLNNTQIEIRGSTLRVDPGLATELENLRTCSIKSGWERGTSLLDYTRWSPGIAYMLDAQVPESLVPVIGGYEGSRAFALEVVRAEIDNGRAESFLKQAWLLLPIPDSRQAAELFEITEEALGEFGRSLSDYQSVCVTDSFKLVKPESATG